MKISVIIAAYNAEKYLESALDSILTQTLSSKDYEVIVINDGSTDSTESIVKKYAKEYKNCHCYSQKNMGPAAARNLGLSKAKGDYLYFFDADDVVDPDALSQLYKKAKKEKADIVIARYDIFNEYTISSVTNINALTKAKNISKYDPRLLWTFTLWNKLFRRQLVEDTASTFPDLSYSEDGVFTMHMVLHSEKITGLPYIVLHYRRNYDLNASSITASISPWKIQHFLEAHERIRQDIIGTIMEDYPEYGTFEETLQKETTAALFYHEFEIKELQTLYNQFYSHYWTSDSDSRELTLERLDWKLSHASFASKNEILDRNPELYYFKKEVLPKELALSARINVCLYGTPEDSATFIQALASICSSNYVSYRVIMPWRMKKFVKQSGMSQENFAYVFAGNREVFYQKATYKYKAEFSLFTESGFLYTYNALNVAMKRMDSENLDYCSESVFCWNEEHQTFLLGSKGTYFPLPYVPEEGEEIIEEVPLKQEELTKEEEIALLESMVEPEPVDNILANKIFKTSFILPLLTLPYERLFSEIYTKGYHAFLNHQSVLLKRESVKEMSLVHAQKTGEK